MTWESSTTSPRPDGRDDFGLVILAFNSLLCLTDFDAQIATLQCARRHLIRTGKIVVDAVNPLRLPVAGDPVPKPFFTRTSEATGQPYTRFAALGAFEDTQRQRLFGWYDERRRQASSAQRQRPRHGLA